MAHHILDIKNIDWVKHMKNCILIRHPSDVITSYSKQNKIENIEQLGYIQQIQIYKRLTEYLIDRGHSVNILTRNKSLKSLNDIK